MIKSKEIDKRTIRSKAALKSALLSLLAESPLEAITITNIIQQAGYCRATFYSYYKDKADFITQIICDEIKSFVSIMLNTIKQSPEAPIEKFVYSTSLKYFQHVYNNHKLYRFVINYIEMNQQSNSVYDLIYREMKQQITFEAVDKAFLVNNELFSYSYIHLYLSFIRYWLKDDLKLSPHDMATQLTLFSTKKIDTVAKHQQMLLFVIN